MSQTRDVKQRKYFRRIYQWMMLSSLLPLTIFALIAYYNVEQTVLANEYKANKQILLQIKDNIDYMNDMLLHSVMSFYYNADIHTIMYNTDSDLADTLDAMNKIKSSIANTNPFIQSIYVYNPNTGIFYTTLQDLFFRDKHLDVLTESGDFPALKPIPRTIEYSLGGDRTREENVITYFMYDFKDADNRMKGGLVVNASTEWLLSNIRNLNRSDKNAQDKIMILDDHGEIVGNNPEDAAFNADLRAAYRADVQDGAAFFTQTIRGTKYVVTYTSVTKMNWTLVKAQRYDEVLKKTGTLKITYLLITGVFLLLAFVGSFTISRRLYRPIGHLVKQVVSANQELDPREAKDEISYLNEAYRHSLDQLAHYRTRGNSDREIRKTYVLRRLLIDSASVSAEELGRLAEENGLALRADEPFVVCIVKLDDMAGFEQSYSPADKRLIRFGIMNIASEIVGSAYPNEAVEMKNDYIAVLLNVGRTDQAGYGRLTELWQEAQEYIGRYFHVSISVAMSAAAEDCRLLSELHYAALDDSLYRLVRGRGCILHPPMLEANRHNTQLGYSALLEKRLLEAAKAGSIPDVESSLDRIFAEIATLSYHNVLLSVMQLINVLSGAFEEMSRSKVEPVIVNFNLIAQRLFELETLDEVRTEMTRICREAMTQTGKLENEKQSILVEAVKELIHADYRNANLNAAYIADRLHLSAKHVAKVFAGQTGVSLSDYINDVRLAKAADWLENANLSIKEMLQRIGIENESYFYKLFKKKYGITPKEYALHHAVRKIHDKT